METGVSFPSFRELLCDAGDSTGRGDHPDVLAQVSPAPPHKVPVCQVSVTTVRNEMTILMASLFAVLCPKWEKGYVFQ